MIKKVILTIKARIFPGAKQKKETEKYTREALSKYEEALRKLSY